MFRQVDFKLHHVSLTRGYVSVKRPEGILEEYHGRFGDGYVLLKHNPFSTQFCFKEYYIIDSELPSVDYGEYVNLEEYSPSSECGDYSPSNPWDAPGMSIKDFI